jgi:hypothetical protein
VSPVGLEKSLGINEGIVIYSQQVLVSVVECPLANRFHLMRIEEVIVAARKEDFVGQRLTQERLRRWSALIRLRDCVSDLRAVEKFVIDAFGQSRQPRCTLGVDTGTLVESAETPLSQVVLRVVINVIIKPMACENRYE